MISRRCVSFILLLLPVFLLLLPGEIEGARKHVPRPHPISHRQAGLPPGCYQFCKDWVHNETNGELGDWSFTVDCYEVWYDYNGDLSDPNAVHCVPNKGESIKAACPTDCDGHCDKYGTLECPELLEPDRRTTTTTTTTTLSPATIDKLCLPYCQNPNRLPPDKTFDKLPYEIDCDDSFSSDKCGFYCPDCPKLGNANCQNGMLKCGPLDESVLPKKCRHFCETKAWERDLTLDSGPFSVDCGEEKHHPDPHWPGSKRMCGRGCPRECNGFCVQLELHCPAVTPVEPTTTTTTTRRPIRTSAPHNSGELGGPEMKESGGTLEIVLIVLGVLFVVAICGVVGCWWWWRKRKAVAPNPNAAAGTGFPGSQQQPAFQMPQAGGAATTPGGNNLFAPGTSPAMTPGATHPTAPGASNPFGPGTSPAIATGTSYTAAPGATYPTSPGASNPFAPGVHPATAPGGIYPTIPGATPAVAPPGAYPMGPGSAFTPASSMPMAQPPPGSLINPNATLLTQKYSKPNFPSVAERLQQAYPRPQEPTPPPPQPPPK